VFNFFKISYREKRSMVLWRRAYAKKLSAKRSLIMYKYGIDSNKVLLNETK